MLRSKVRIKNMEKIYMRKVARTGKRSLSIVIPAEIAADLKIKEKQKLSIKRVKGGIFMRDFRSKK